MYIVMDCFYQYVRPTDYHNDVAIQILIQRVDSVIIFKALLVRRTPMAYHFYLSVFRQALV